MITMEYNPFTLEYNRLCSVIEHKNSEKSIIDTELKWFDNTEIGDLFHLIESEKKSKNNYKAVIDGIEKETVLIARNIQETNECTKSLFNPFNWFDEDQKNIRKKLNGLKTELSAKQVHKKRTLQSLSETEKSINKIGTDIAKHEEFDRQKVNNDVSRLDQEILLLNAEIKRISNSKNNVDTALRPVIEQIIRYESSISGAKGKINNAQSLERKLDSADNSYERAMIHEKCEKTFGDGSPKKIIREQERTIRKHERDLEKAKKRAIQIGKKASREIKRIVIDGNNMCYEGNEFVGLLPLIESTSELQKQYKVTVVFDSAIRSQVKANDRVIRAKFNNNIKVHIVATKQLADETILEIASGDDLYYILSNDRFGEYAEKEVLRNNRVIRHEIVDKKVIIHDLNINVGYD